MTLGPDVIAWQALQAQSQPVPFDLERGHALHLAAWKIVDGGIVEWRHQAFCRCNWSQRWPTATQDAAILEYLRHLWRVHAL